MHNRKGFMAAMAAQLAVAVGMGEKHPLQARPTQGQRRWWGFGRRRGGVRLPNASKYKPHQGYQECARRKARLGVTR